MSSPNVSPTSPRQISDWRRSFDDRVRAAERRPDDAPRLPGLLLGLLDRLPRSSGSFAANGFSKGPGSKCNPCPPCPTKLAQRHPGKKPPAPLVQQKPIRSFSTVGGRSRFLWQEGRSGGADFNAVLARFSSAPYRIVADHCQTKKGPCKAPTQRQIPRCTFHCRSASMRQMLIAAAALWRRWLYNIDRD